MVVVAVALGRKDQRLAPRERYLYFAAKGECCNGRVRLDVGVALAAEAAADGRARHADALGGQIQDRREHVLNFKRRLRTGGDAHHTGALIVFADGAFRLDVGVLLPFKIVIAFERLQPRRFFGRGKIAGGKIDRAYDLPPAERVAVFDLENAGQRLIFHAGELCRRAGVRLSIGHDERKHVAEEVHFRIAEHRLLGIERRIGIPSRHVLMRQHTHNARGALHSGKVHGEDLGARMLRPDERAVKRVRVGAVAGKGQRARHLGRTVDVDGAAADVAAGEVLRRHVVLALVFYDLEIFPRPHIIHGRVFPAQARRRQMHRLDDLHIAGAAAVVVFQRFANLLVRRVRIYI